MSDLKDEEIAGLLVAVRNGDADALDKLFARFYLIAVRIAELRLGKRIRGDHDAEDIAQESLIEALAKLGTFEMRSDGDLRNWLARIVENNVRDASRRANAKKRGSGRTVRYADLSASSLRSSIFPRTHSTPSGHAQEAEQEQRIEAALTTGLNEKYREVIVLRCLCGLGYDAIAREMGYDKEATVRVMFSRALDELKRTIEPAAGAGA